MSRDIDEAWNEVAGFQQAGLDAALARSKQRKPKSLNRGAAGLEAAVNGTFVQMHDSNGNVEGTSGLPDQAHASLVEAGQASGAGQAQDSPEEPANGHLISEENQAANRQLPAFGNAATSSMGKSQVHLLIGGHG